MPGEHGEGRHVYNQYTIRVASRDRVRENMTCMGVASEVDYARTLHLQECFTYLGYRRGDLPAAEEASSGVLSIPIDAGLNEDELIRVSDAVG